MELTLDLSALKPAQRRSLLALLESFYEPYYIPTSDDQNGVVTDINPDTGALSLA